MHERHADSSSTPPYDVAIAGAGPVGLFLACELRLAGLSVLVLEGARNPASPLKQRPFGMRGLSAPTIEAFYRRGLLADLTAAQNAKERAGDAGAHWMQQSRRPGGHFAGIQFFLDNVYTSKWVFRLPTPVPTNLATTMQEVEAVLADRASAMGVEIRRGVAVEDFRQSDEEVAVKAGKEAFNARWLVGCDGGRSVVRKTGGFEFAGTDPEFTGYSVEVEMSDPEKLRPGRHYTSTGMYTFQKPGVIAMVEFDGGAFHRAHAITLEHVQAVLRRVSGTDVTIATLHASTTWTDRAYQAKEYRRGRVLLAGDAAHVHSPLGGQGLNLGLGDALNLGWKLAATIRGSAPIDLLDTYERERHPVGALVLDWSRAQVAIMRPNPGSRALGAIIRDLIDTRDGATYFAERIWGVSLTYDLGASHPLAGRSAPDFELLDGTRLGNLLATGKGLFMDFTPDGPFRELAGRWNDRINYVAGAVRNSLGARAVLIRPDGFVAWACSDATTPEEAVPAFSRWFGDAKSAGAE